MAFGALNQALATHHLHLDQAMLFPREKREGGGAFELCCK